MRRVDPNAVRQPVQKERPQIGGGFDGDGFDRRILVTAAHRDRFVHPVEAQDRGPQLGRRILGQGFDHPPVGRQLGVNQGSLYIAPPTISRRRIALRIFDGELPAAAGKMIDQKLCYRNLVFGRFGQRNADRIADTVRQKRSDTDSTLDAPLDPVPCLGDAQVERIIHPFPLHRVHQKPVGRHHDPRIARLHRHHNLIERLLATDAQELHRRGYHAFGRIAPLVENALRERTVIHAYADRHTALPALVDEGFELPVRRVIVSGIDTHLIHVFRSDRSHFGHEMDVRNDGGIAPLLPQTADDPLQILSLPTPLGRQPDDRPPGPENAFDLPDAGFGILGVGIGHRLHGDRTIPSDHNPSDADFTARAAFILGQIHVLPEFITTKVVKMKAG